MTLVVATRNAGKVEEIRAALTGLLVDLVSAAELLPEAAPIEEVGETFQENATLKARAVAEATQLVSLADDSGLEVDALDGKPGVRSARYSGEDATDAENNAALLSALSSIEANGVKGRRARFRCVMALVDPFGESAPVLAEGTCEGSIAHAGRGTGGFGYDPLFVVDGLDKTFAELTPGEKLELSHRGKALRTMRLEIEQLVRARLDEASLVLTLRSHNVGSRNGGGDS